MKSVSKEQRKEQLDIVLRLNKLTKRGKINWEEGWEDDVLDSGYKTYEAEWKGHRIVAEPYPRSKSFGNKRGQLVTRNSSTGRVTSRATHRLCIKPIEESGSNDSKIVIPPMPAIDDLVSTIDRRMGERVGSKGGVEELQSFKRLLDEEL